ncbi:MAG: hypothetical protein DYH15_00560 [Nitrosomonas sp. PRO4]|nr:hypothetical protein [Nitrosomonas sp. PRO4]
MATTMITAMKSEILFLKYVVVTMMACFAVNSNLMATTTYTDEASFSTALGSAAVTMESFESLPTGNGASLLASPAVEVSCDGSAWCSGFFGVSAIMPTDGAQGVYFATPDSITFTFLEPITAFAIDVGDLGTRGATNFSAVLSNGNTATFFTDYTGTSFGQSFVGIVDSVAFSTITFYGTVMDDGIYFDRMQTALADIPPVLEPNHYFMLITGLGFLGVLAAYRKRNKVSI